ncbi:methyltransferase domain-containing protein [Helicobacter felis]|uniref:methyltransferase domain-containing protein n=1 Tax=Helicobacter felis TaxID=214 RepID=UPI000CF05688|nr:methyltransferase domain-containing protein [Helicobacter felis]
MQVKTIRHSFNKAAKTYARYARVQQRVIQHLLKECSPGFYKRILDLGCGEGGVLRELENFKISTAEFIGVDKALGMLQEHPREGVGAHRVRLVHADFEQVDLSASLCIAASSLQWAQNLEKLCAQLAKHYDHIALALHTNASLKELHTFLGTPSPLRGKAEILKILQTHFIGFQSKIWIEKFQENFNTRAEFLAHLKHTGLLGGGLDFKRAKALRLHAPYTLLSYEVVMLVGQLKKGHK